jgi:predicted O-methyltransferase YrrM
MSDLGDLSPFMARVRDSRTPDAWPSVEKCQVLSALVIALRPDLAVEIGVWKGDSLIPVLMAMAHVGHGRAVAIDPWSADASSAGMEGPNHAWWSKVDHEAIYKVFADRLTKGGLWDRCQILRKASRDIDPVTLGPIDLLHIDGNHGEEAFADIANYGRQVPVGGIMVLDDLDWTGGAVRRGMEHAVQCGFRMLFTLGTGCVLQRIAV